MARRPKTAQTRSPKLSRGIFCAAVHAQREDGNDNLPRAPRSSCPVVRVRSGGGIDNVGSDGRTHK
eukprot:14753677-Alexandrium_andersonii.AAC.1